MLDSRAPDAAREQAASEAKARLEAKGEILHEANWGVRKMAYQIDRRDTSDYRFYKFNGNKELLDELGHSLKIDDSVLRFRIFKADLEAPTAEPPDSEQIMRRDEDDRERGGRREGRGGPRRPRRDDGERGGDGGRGDDAGRRDDASHRDDASRRDDATGEARDRPPAAASAE